MKTTFLHLSDLHFRNNWEEECGLVTTRFFEDLKVQITKYNDPYLIFSGDVVYAGQEPTLYQTFEDAFARHFETTGLSKSKRICTPGNHDVSRSALNDICFLQ
jgi:3',5'-cyclic AMP phosphodiesterase CpdA